MRPSSCFCNARSFVTTSIALLVCVAAALSREAAKPDSKPAAKAGKRGEGSSLKITPAGKKTSVAVPLESKEFLKVGAKVDELILAELKKTQASPAARCSDEDFLRRASLDITGSSPSPQDVALFGLDTDQRKREKTVERLLASSDFGQNWSRYWRDVIFMRATEMRAPISRESFDTWMAGELNSNKPWDQVVTSLLTATGDVRENGQTALIFAHDGQPQELAAESSRIFLGIQLQCANCHDHPTDSWKREQFHTLAAFFPRIRVQPKRQQQPPSFEVVSLNVGPANGRPGQGDFLDLLQNPEKLMERADRNRDGKISKEEAALGPNGGQFFGRLVERADTNKDGAISLAELKQLPPPPQTGRGSSEYFMPDLQNPQSKGTKIDPVFFVSEEKLAVGLGDQERRQALSRFMTSKDNTWFAKAFVNRMWAELVGEGFYMPVDDIGPERTANYPDALEVLAAGFAANNYEVKWLFRAIANSETYQRRIRARDPKQPAPLFSAGSPSRLRADQLYDALARVLGFIPDAGVNRGGMAGGPRFFDNSPRGLFNLLFAFDPSTPPDDITGTVPQALFMMNSPLINSSIQANGKTRLSKLLADFKDDKDVLTELYLLVHAREPSTKELEVCQGYLKQAASRQEGFEDILWSLLNSTEFQTKR